MELSSCYTNDIKLRKRVCDTQQLLDYWQEKLGDKHTVCAKQAVLHFVKAVDTGVTVRECSLYERWSPSAINILDSRFLVFVVSSHYKLDTTQGHKVKKR